VHLLVLIEFGNEKPCITFNTNNGLSETRISDTDEMQITGIPPSKEKSMNLTYYPLVAETRLVNFQCTKLKRSVPKITSLFLNFYLRMLTVAKVMEMKE
jgi:hypothetical protein